MASFSAGDPAGRILSAREPAGRTGPVGPPSDTWLRQMDRHFTGGWDRPCGGLEDGHQETKGVPLQGRCGNALPHRILPLTDYTWLRQMDGHFAGVGDGPWGGLEDGHRETEGVPVEGRCGNAPPRRMLPLTD